MITDAALAVVCCCGLLLDVKDEINAFGSASKKRGSLPGGCNENSNARYRNRMTPTSKYHHIHGNRMGGRCGLVNEEREPAWNCVQTSITTEWEVGVDL